MIFPKDRVEIRSPGLLYGGLTIETIRTKMVSERRNELIAEMLHRVHFIEKWGRGIKLILSREPDTEFSEVGTKFITTFKRRSYFEGKKVVENLTQKTTQRILEAITKKSDITQKELAVVIGITEDGVKYHITRLRKKGVLKRIGPAKGGYWEVVKK